MKKITETKEQREERRKFADALFNLSCIPAEVLSDKEFNQILSRIKKPEHMKGVKLSLEKEILEEKRLRSLDIEAEGQLMSEEDQKSYYEEEI